MPDTLDNLKILSVRLGRIVSSKDGRLWICTRGDRHWQVVELTDVTDHGTPVWEPCEYGDEYPYPRLADAYQAILEALEDDEEETSPAG